MFHGGFLQKADQLVYFVVFCGSLIFGKHIAGIQNVDCLVSL